MPKAKVLVITGALPYPLVTGAKIRTFNLLKALGGQFDIELLTVLKADEEKPYIDEISRAGIKCHYIYRKDANNPVSKGMDALLSFFFSQPYLTRRYTFSKYWKRLYALLSEKEYDVIHCDSISMTGNFQRIARKKLILTQHNLEQNIWAGYAHHASGFLAGTFYRNQYRKVKLLEENLDKTYGYVVTVSGNDKNMLGQYFPKDKIIVVENGVDPKAYQSDIPANQRQGIVFTGSLDWHPNIDGLNWYADTIYPELMKLMPDCATTVVGRKPSKSLTATLGSIQSINLHADVPEIQPYLHSARVMMVPLRIGGGSRLKILEAMAAGLPVVSTTKGAEGLAVTNGEDILIEDNPKRFAEALVQVMQDKDLYQKLCLKGRELIEARYSWERVTKPLAELWKRVSDA